MAKRKARKTSASQPSIKQYFPAAADAPIAAPQPIDDPRADAPEPAASSQAVAAPSSSHARVKAEPAEEKPAASRKPTARVTARQVSIAFCFFGFILRFVYSIGLYSRLDHNNIVITML